MSVRERDLGSKPASEMTPEEWRSHQRQVNEELVASGKEPIDWSRWAQPTPLTEERRQRALETFRRVGKL
jgi:hypothetical protein